MIHCEVCDKETDPKKDAKDNYTCSRCQHLYMPLRVNMYLEAFKKKKLVKDRKDHNAAITRRITINKRKK